MSTQALFIQGAGQGAYAADAKLVASLRHLLGPEYEVHYPVMPHEDDAEYESWKDQIASELTALNDPVLLVGHSVGASILLKFLTETEVEKTIAAIFLIATPFWGGDGWRYEGYTRLALQEGFAARLPKTAPIFLYHSRDDEIAPFAHLGLYAQRMPQATSRALDGRDHQLNNDLLEVAEDMRNLRR
jgi:hypothetical protein